MDKQKITDHIGRITGLSVKGQGEDPLLETYRAEAERKLLYAIIVAGKSARFAENATKRFLLFKGDDETPFQYIKRLGYNRTGAELRNAGTGNYKRIIRAIDKISRTDVYSWTLEKLVEVHGIGPKTARFWLTWAIGQDQYAVLDVHILRWMNYLGYRVPKTTPPSPRYEEIEKIFLAEANERDLEPSSLDTLIWEFCNAGRHRTEPWPKLLQRRD